MASNDVVIEAWNTVLFQKFTRFKHLLVNGLAGHSDEILGRNLFAPGARVLDIGCGFGDSTIRIARAVGPRGEAVGVDCASNFIAAAQSDARSAGADNASFTCVDVQSGELRGPYDHAFARFGTMFFDLPGAAFRNVRRALRPGGTLTQVVWRRREDNPWVFEAEQCARAIMPVVAHDETDQVHCGPGPFSLAGPDLVSGLLRGAGYDRIAFERFDADICIGRTLAEAVEFAVALGPAGEIVRLAGDAGTPLLPTVGEALRGVLKKYEREGGVWAPSSSWFVTARARP